MEVIGEQAQNSMVAAVEEVKKLPLYETNKGEVMYSSYSYCSHVEMYPIMCVLVGDY